MFLAQLLFVSLSLGVIAGALLPGLETTDENATDDTNNAPEQGDGMDNAQDDSGADSGSGGDVETNDPGIHPENPFDADTAKINGTKYKLFHVNTEMNNTYVKYTPDGPDEVRVFDGFNLETNRLEIYDMFNKDPNSINELTPGGTYEFSYPPGADSINLDTSDGENLLVYYQGKLMAIIPDGAIQAQKMDYMYPGGKFIRINVFYD